MSFDEQLRRVFSTLADRLRDEVGNQVEHAHLELVSTARTDDLAVTSRLLDAIRALDRARSLSEILDTLGSCAAREAARIAIFLVRDELRTWRAIGFESDPPPRVLPLGESGIIADSVRTGAVTSSETPGVVSAPAFARLPGGRQCVAIPIAMSGGVVAVLYADQGPEDATRQPPLTWPERLEVMARHAAQRLEAATAVRAVRALSGKHDAPAASSPHSGAGTERAQAGTAKAAPYAGARVPR